MKQYTALQPNETVKRKPFPTTGIPDLLTPFLKMIGCSFFDLAPFQNKVNNEKNCNKKKILRLTRKPLTFKNKLILKRFFLKTPYIIEHASKTRYEAAFMIVSLKHH